MTMTLMGDGGRDEKDATVPFFDHPEVVAAVQEEVNLGAPRLFAVVQEFSDPVAVEIAAWGMATEGSGVHAFSVRGGAHLSLRSPESALKFFLAGGRAVPRIVWVGGAVEQ